MQTAHNGQGVRRAWERISVLPWVLDPRIRRCPECRLTWETPAQMRELGGVCHDCYIDHIDYAVERSAGKVA